jgi:hypothetical protein
MSFKLTALYTVLVLAIGYQLSTTLIQVSKVVLVNSQMSLLNQERIELNHQKSLHIASKAQAQSLSSISQKASAAGFVPMSKTISLTVATQVASR